ncbi:MAG: translation initiation factor IF-2 [Microgenomates group bacterium]
MEKTRQPIVTVLGHVDHGKTTFLDVVRKTSVAKKEAGGITQSIGASVVSTKGGKKITFIDTPGHAAFVKMRSRGAKLADVAILVVAGDGGVKPQTKEALIHIREAEIPFIVAVTKIDIASSSVETVRGQLEKEGVLFEGKGGDTPLVSLSAKEGKGINDLLEMIILVSEVNEIKADEKGKLEGVVIETSKDRWGSLVSVVIRNGTLSVRDEILAENIDCKVRGLFDGKGRSIKKTLPGEPVLILGFSELPPVGAKVSFLKDKGKIKEKEKKISVPKVEEGQIPIVFKAQSVGALEALLANLPPEVVAVSSGVGEVNKSDVFFAKAAGPAHIFTFETKISLSIKKLAETEGVTVESFNVIYKLLERLEELIKEGETEVLGKAEIIASFPFDDKLVAGCRVISGRIKVKDTMLLMRKDKELGEVKALSIKKQKQKMLEVKEGEEFGVIFEPQLDFEKGDVLVSVRK